MSISFQICKNFNQYLFFQISILGLNYTRSLMATCQTTQMKQIILPSVTIKARGMSIGRAVDVSQIISRKTENAGYSIGNIKIGSEPLESQDGRTRNVSTIEIEVKRN